MYQRIGKAAYKADLNNTIALCELLGNPQRELKCIHIAGTNGKGSVAHILSSILQTAGLKVGLYTSPHYRDFRERVRINGQMISEEDVVEFVGRYKDGFETIEPSFFEMTAGLAFYQFTKDEVDIAILEVGMGGRLDSTNVITPLISVITNIGYDHMEFLGDTLEKIAVEKAGIIKKGVPVVIGESNSETDTVFVDVAEEKGSELFFAEQRERVSDLRGDYQRKNISTALHTIDVLNTMDYNITDDQIEIGLQNIVKNTQFMGRWQKISESPLTICDAGHNVDGIREVIAQLKNTMFKNLHFVFGTVNDKNIDSVLELLPKNAIYYFCKADIPRALDAKKLATQAAKFGLHGTSYPSVNSALDNAQKNAGSEDLVFIGGSSFVIAEVV